MASQGRNAGFHMLPEFVCEAIPGSNLPPRDPPDAQYAAFLAAIKIEIERVAQIIARTEAPANAMELFQRFLRKELDAIQRRRSSSSEPPNGDQAN
jgi:hypothetical protein